MQPTRNGFAFCNARLLGQTGLFDVTVKAGRIAAVEPAAGLAASSIDGLGVGIDAADGRAYELGGRLLLPGFVDIHTHLDKALTLPFTENPEGTLAGAIHAYHAYEPTVTADDVYQRALRTAQSALAHGTTTMRTHVNFGHDGTLFERSLAGLVKAREALRGWVDVQIVVMCPLAEHPAAQAILERGAARHLVAIGGAPHLAVNPRANMAWIVGLARKFGLTVDVHVDEQLNPQAQTLDHLCELVEDAPFAQPVVAGHAVSLDAMSPALATTIGSRVAAANIGVVTLPGANLFLQGRADTEGARRGVTRVKLLQSLGVQVAAASDNIQDVFHPYGRGDLLEAALLTAYAAHFQPADAEIALRMISDIPGRLAVHPDYGVVVGQVADLVILNDSDPLAALQSMAPDRWVFKGGRLVAATHKAIALSPDFPMSDPSVHEGA